MAKEGWLEQRALTAIIIIFTSPRVIKAACYTCSAGGRPYSRHARPPFVDGVGVVVARGRGGWPREEGSETTLRAIETDVVDGGVGGGRGRGRRGVVFTRQGCWWCCAVVAASARAPVPFLVYCCPIERTDEPVSKHARHHPRMGDRGKWCVLGDLHEYGIGTMFI
ncbi:uncharacterized protein LOC143183391 [Calliopsis andreniformis]|uniref:uncharacterized protein LOC143183391 n=1 Tax=Calliopsis andreniformis TaxID=337506 RepID=UPI003FCCD7FC